MRQKINILYLCNSPKVMAGVEKTVLLLLEKISKEQFSARVILNGYGPFYDILVEQGVEVEVIECRAKFSLSFVKKLKQSLNKRSADIVQLHLSRFYAPFIHTSGAKVVERLNMTRHKSSFYLMRNKFIDCQTAKWIDMFIVVSDSMKQQFVKRGYPSEKLTRIYNGIEVPCPKESNKLKNGLNLSPNSILIGTAVRFTRQKAVDVFLKAAAIISRKLPNAFFPIAGDGELMPNMIELSKQLNIYDKVIFLGFRSDILDVIASFDIMLYPSRWEPFSNTILEAMSLDIPVVTTNVGGNAEAIQHNTNGLLFPVNDFKEAANITADLVRDKKKRLRLIKQAGIDIEKYSTKNMVHEHEEIYSSLL